jgi:membrane-associated protease RseP (regulator of RpoE activity)
MNALTTAIASRRVQPKLLTSAMGPLRPVVVAVAVFSAAFTWSAGAHADPGDDAANPAPGSVDSGAAADAVAQAGQSICSTLVQPGSDLAGAATQQSGNGGFAPLIVGYIAGAAIQAQCPGLINSVANGNLPVAIPGMPPGDSGAAPPN